VAIGEQFTITGAELYPGLVTAVFIDGTTIDIANVTPKGESPPQGSGVFTVEVLVPSETNGEATPTGEVPVEIQTEFNDQTTNSNAMSIKITD